MRRLALISGLLVLTATSIFPQVSVVAEKESTTRTTATATRTAQLKLREARKALAVNLLKQSHALNDQLENDEKLGPLYDQANCVMAANKTLGRQWARELFDLGSREDSDFGKQAQMRAIDVLSRQYPEEALALLEQVDPKLLAADSNEFLGSFFEFSEAERQVFLHIVLHRVKDGLPKLVHAASALGDKGRYPYSPLMSAAMAMRDPKTTESVARMLFTRFQQRSDAPFAVFEFADMLRLSEERWPRDLMKPSIEAIVEMLYRYEADKDSRETRLQVSTSQGSTIAARGPVEIELLRLAPLMKKYHPELLEKLTQLYPFLAEPAAFALPGSGAKEKLIRPQNSRPSAYNRHRAIFDLKQEIMDDPLHTEQIISSVSDPELRVEALAFASNMFSASDTGRAARLAAEAEKSVAQVENSLPRLQALCARVRADSASGHHAQVAEELDSAFLMADKLMRKAVEDGDSTFEIQRSLWEAVSEAVKLEPELTINHIRGVYLPNVQSQLLIAAARALFPSAY